MKNILLPILITILVIQILVVFAIRPYGYNISSMIGIGGNEGDAIPQYFQKGMVIFGKLGVYDGGCYYYIARDPFIQKGYYKSAYRYQRILYPLLAYLFSFGNERLIPYTLYWVNLLALTIGMWFAILILRGYSLSPMWSLCYGLSASSIMTIQNDFPSPLSISLLIIGVYFYFKEKLHLATFFIAIAFLTHENSIMVLLPLLIWDYQNKKQLKRIMILISCLIPFFLWQLFVTIKLGEIPLATSVRILSFIPFSGIVGYIKTIKFNGMLETAHQLTTFVFFLYCIFVLIIMVRRLFLKRNFFYYIVAAYGLLAIFTIPDQWKAYNGLLRMFYGMFPFLIFSYGIEKNREIKYAIYGSSIFTFLAIIRKIFILPVFPFKIW